MPYRHYPPSTPLLFGYDPERDLPLDHLARLVDQVVEEAIQPPRRPPGPGQPPFDPRLPVKVLVYGYATGIRSSRQMERLCRESLPFLFLTRGDTPSYRTLCSVRVDQRDLMEQVFVALFVVAGAAGMQRVGHIVVDSTKMRANASPEAVLARDEYEPMRQEVERILEEARVIDEREEKEGRPGETHLGKTVERDQMRDIVRRVRKQLARQKAQKEQKGAQQQKSSEPEKSEKPEPRGRAMSWRMVRQLVRALAAIEAAVQEGRKHLCLTDPEARMMHGGRVRTTAECHSFEVAVDRGAGLLVAGQTSQAGNDNERLEPLVQAAQANEPAGVVAADADSGYYQGDAVGRLMDAGVDTCIPDSNTAGDLHHGLRVGTLRDQKRGRVPLSYDAEADRYQCPAGNTLRPTQERQHGGQQIKVYRATASCVECTLAGDCLTQPNARRRTHKVGQYERELEAARQRFNEPEHQERYRHRAEAVETVFGFVRGTLGYTRWLLRGSGRVACEGTLLKVAYQLRKVHAAGAVT